MDVRDEIRQFISAELMHRGMDATVDNTDSLVERCILDSLGLLRVLGFLESEYRMTVRDDDVIPENFESVNAIAAFVERYRHKG